MGVDNTYKKNKDEIHDYEAIDRQSEFVVLLLVFLVTFSPDELDVFTFRSTTVEIKPGFAVFHLGEYSKEDDTNYDPKNHYNIVNFAERFWLQII